MKIIIPTIALIALTSLNTYASQGETLYKTYCISCHGDKAHGDGPAASALTESPSNIYEGLTSFFESDAELMETVLYGNEEMPAWGSVLNEKQVNQIFDYIKSIN
ncbi:hypothetical protein JCM19240_788 [Vibrio maritimus]|uniref:Cytochrome c domain-containing protein n=1 Tax=Vibrio maritimus TaxID=990268 RepID=A0A090T1I5_9VIBR|nr:hypothetical protein JCM19240_788 [Vibrio maritimus]